MYIYLQQSTDSPPFSKDWLISWNTQDGGHLFFGSSGSRLRHMRLKDSAGECEARAIKKERKGYRVVHRDTRIDCASGSMQGLFYKVNAEMEAERALLERFTSMITQAGLAPDSVSEIEHNCMEGNGRVHFVDSRDYAMQHYVLFIMSKLGHKVYVTDIANKHVRQSDMMRLLQDKLHTDDIGMPWHSRVMAKMQGSALPENREPVSHIITTNTTPLLWQF